LLRALRPHPELTVAGDVLDVAHVVSCVDFARENGVLLAVRGGGHNGAGLVADLDRPGGALGVLPRRAAQGIEEPRLQGDPDVLMDEAEELVLGGRALRGG